jgi:hypothetical protein
LPRTERTACIRTIVAVASCFRMNSKPNLSDPRAPRLAHFARALTALFRGKIGGKPWNKHLHRGWRSLMGDARFLPQPVIPLAVPDPSKEIQIMSQKIMTLTSELARHRNIGNPTLLRHLAELGNRAP